MAKVANHSPRARQSPVNPHLTALIVGATLETYRSLDEPVSCGSNRPLQCPPVSKAATNGFAPIAERLRADVLRGRLQPGAQLPAISELAGLHRTTPITVRRALRELEDEGLVRVEHGVGTFVADWSRQYDLLHLPGFSREVAEGGLETRVVSLRAGVPEPDAARALELPDAAPLWALERVRLRGGVPVVFQTSYVGEALRNVVEGYGPDQSLYEALARQVGRAPVAAEETLEAVLLTGPAAEALQAPEGSPGWRSVRTTLGPAGEPLVYDDAVLPASRVRVRVQRRSGQALMSFEIVDS